MKNNLYVHRKVLNANSIVEWMRDNDVSHCVDPSAMHITQMYSKKEVDWDKIKPKNTIIHITKTDRQFKLFGHTLVLVIKSNILQKRFKQFMNIGCSFDYAKYNPHISIQYDTNSILKIKPYDGEIILGPEIFSTIDYEFEAKELMLESFILDDDNIDHIYDVFADSYLKSTGTTWSKEQFIRRARQWDFYGDENGYIAVRSQRSGYVKLVGVAGAPRSILKGLHEIQQLNLPLWGAVSAPIALMAKKQGFIYPSSIPGGKLIIRAIFNMIDPSVFGGMVDITNDGQISIDTKDFGTVEKEIIFNKTYLRKLISSPEFTEKLEKIPGIKLFLKLCGI